MSFLRCILVVTVLSGTAGLARAEDMMLAVPNVTLYPGDVIGEAQIVERAFAAGTTGKLPVAEQRSAVVGKVARRTLLPGKPIPLHGLKDPDAVTRGTTVIAMFKAGGLTITSAVTPLRSGQVGDTIEARNTDSGQIIRGVIQADGTLRVGFVR
jgi:flagellar basal body P-ring formation protein FlgA